MADVHAVREDVTTGWPARPLPGVCARTGLPTRSGVVLTPRGASYRDAEVIVPFSEAATLRRRALRRVAGLALLVGVGCGVAAAFSWFLLVPALAAVAVALFAARNARSLWIFPVVDGRELVIPNVHPAFVAAVAAMPERCGRTEGGGCETCTSSCLPQVQAT